MAVRLACPACGKAFTPKAADAGRVVPCARCGSDLQMPAAAPARPESRSNRPEPDARPSLLWLWVLLGSGLVGLCLGAAVFYFALREEPRVSAPVAERPRAEPPTDPPQPKVEPAKVDAPKIPAPKVEPKAEAPKVVVPPKPKVQHVAPPVADGLTAANVLPGLRFYLACDVLEDGKVTEVVSGKALGKQLELTDGPRGKALRLAHHAGEPNRCALDLTDARDNFAIPANRPFTLAFWARRVQTDAAKGSGAFLFEARSEPAKPHVRILTVQMLPNEVAFVPAVLQDAADRNNAATLRTANPANTVADPAGWNHFALVRDDAGRVRWLVNGADAPDARVLRFPGELRYDALTLLRSAELRTAIDFDELCLFDRVLTELEFTALTGLQLAPGPKELPAPPPPPPGGAVAANDIPGLRFHLACDAIGADGALAESVSGKNVGTGRKLELVDGPRGKAVRATAFGLGAEREAFDLSEHAGALAVGAGKPFTMALWTRTDNWDNIGGTFVNAQLVGADKFRMLSIYRYTRGVGFLLQQGKPGGGESPINQLARGTREMEPTKGWIHLALTRDEKGTVRMVVNGTNDVTAAGAFTDEVRFTRFVLVWQQGQPFTADFDEFCLFDRVLTDNEIARLAGRKGKDGPAVAIVPKPPAIPPKPPEVAPRGPLEVAPAPRVAAVLEPREVAPLPRVVGPAGPVEPAPAEVARSAPAGVDLKGLLLFLPFDEANGETVREGVSGKFAGKCAGVELVKGARGKAARLAAERTDGAAGACQLDFGDLAERTTVAAGKPFTLALWLRAEPSEPGAKPSGTVLQFGARPDRAYDRALQVGFGAAGTLHCTARSTPDRLDPKRETAARWTGVANPARWTHLATVRDEKNAVRWFVNGKPAPQPGKPDPVWDGPLGFDRVIVGDPEQTKVVLEVDELCLFDRPLTADELKKLSEVGK